MPHYLERHLKSALKEAFDQERIVLLLGARQVGKSTLLKHTFPDIQFFVLDGLYDEFSLRSQADLFLKSFPPPSHFR